MAVRALSFASFSPRPGPVRGELPRRRRVRERAVEDRDQLLAEPRLLDRHDDLDPAVEIARHQVGAAEEDLHLVADLEPVQAAVLEDSGRRSNARVMFSLIPGTPGLSMQIERATISIVAPCWDAV